MCVINIVLCLSQGAEISEFQEKAVGARISSLPEILQTIEDSPKPVVALLHGHALGGGCEVALACHWRIAAANLKIGLPEINLGLLPGAGGTQRLPRLVNPVIAAQMILSGRPISGKEAHRLGIVNALLSDQGTAKEQAIAYALSKASSSPPATHRLSALTVRLSERDHQELRKLEETIAKQRRGEPAVSAIMKTIHAACTLPFAEGMKEESRQFTLLLATPEARALQYVFFAERAANKIPPAYSSPPSPLKTIGIVGSGTMGGGIAMCCVDVGLSVVLLDASQEYLDRGMNVIRENYKTSVSRGRMSEEEMKKRLERIQPTLRYEDFRACDLVVEAVFENMQVKQEVFRQLDSVCKQGAVLASNTSALNVDEIAAATRRPADVIGCHFFSPANVMPLLENVRGRLSSPRTISTAMAFGSLLRKVSILVGNCDGFVANRVMSWYSQEATALILEGASIAQVDKCAYDFGFAMGPFAMSDLVGNDLFARERKKSGVADAKCFVVDALFAEDRHGQKAKRGYYDYETVPNTSRLRPIPSQRVAEIVRMCAENQNISRREAITSEEILDRLLLPMINESFKIIEERIVNKTSDIDIAIVFGYNFPKTKGGPMHYARFGIGFENVVKRLEMYRLNSAVTTKTKEYWTPCSLLVQAAQRVEGSDLDAYLRSSKL